MRSIACEQLLQNRFHGCRLRLGSPSLSSFPFLLPFSCAMAKTRKAGKKNPAEVKVKLEEKQREAVRKEQKQVANSDKTNHALMVEQVLEWFKTHPRGFEHVYRSISLGSFDGLDGNNKEDGDEKLPSYMNKWRLRAQTQSARRGRTLLG